VPLVLPLALLLVPLTLVLLLVPLTLVLLIPTTFT
jgi:hypothetical protein